MAGNTRYQSILFNKIDNFSEQVDTAASYPVVSDIT